MYDQSVELGFPMLAGSVRPQARSDECWWPLGAPIDKALWVWNATFVGNKDAYGFHAIEELQSMVERRSGGETGIRAVQCLEGAPVWIWTDANPWAQRLLAAVAPDLERAAIEDPMVFRFEYVDGLETAIYRLNGHTAKDLFAAQGPGQNKVVVIPRYGAPPLRHEAPAELRDRYSAAQWFNPEVANIEAMILTGRLPHPQERMLLTTGALAALFESSYEPAPNYGLTYQHGRLLKEGRVIETPHLQMCYSL